MNCSPRMGESIGTHWYTHTLASFVFMSMVRSCRCLYRVYAYLTQYRYVINEIVVGQRAHETIAQARFPNTNLTFVFFRAGHPNHRHIYLFHYSAL